MQGKNNKTQGHDKSEMEVHMFKALKELNVYIKPYKRLYISGGLITFLFAIAALVDPYMTGMIIDAIKKEDGREFVIKASLIIVGVTGLRTVMRYKFFMQFEELSQNIVYQLRKDLYKKLQSLDFSFFDRTPNGQIMSNMTGDIEAIRHFFAWITHVTLFHGTVFIVAIIAMIMLNPLLTAVLIVIIPFIGILSLKLSRSVKPTYVNI